MRRIYTLFIYLFVPLIVMRLFLKSRKNISYRERILERFQLAKLKTEEVDTWVHAVSLGEVVAATQLIESLLKADKKVLITTMTPAGSKQVTSKFADKVLHQYVPYDLPWCVKRFFRAYKPKTGVIMETELWPNLLYFANLFGVKLGLVNARISDKAFKQYQKTGKIFKPVLANFSFIGAQSELDAKRFISLGAHESVVSVAGNVKFDITHPGKKLQDFSEFKIAIGEDRIILIAASTHDDEERQLLTRLRKLQSEIPGIILLIAPRHIERFSDVYALSEKLGFKTAKRSNPVEIEKTTEVLVIDSLGEMLSFYQMSDYAFVGGSLVPIGGHNVLEPVVMGVPVFCGPHMQNSRSVCEQLHESGAIGWRKDIDDLVENIIELFNNPTKRKSQISQAFQVLQANQGALQRYIKLIV
ncbi:MAG: 3-deoxy-D-manno-octulosonic acid transferase [Legionellales bacterium RIFCSPHIGHO2_12_FULL_35_11]|nr:MAG: 3-deoxy-D-manno-octulosonic acid transferase [Legionellales bacterium RIFCSPHIGHO2_12_FULL_35_11]